MADNLSNVYRRLSRASVTVRFTFQYVDYSDHIIFFLFAPVEWNKKEFFEVPSECLKYPYWSRYQRWSKDDFSLCTTASVTKSLLIIFLVQNIINYMERLLGKNCDKPHGLERATYHCRNGNKRHEDGWNCNRDREKRSANTIVKYRKRHSLLPLSTLNYRFWNSD